MCATKITLGPSLIILCLLCPLAAVFLLLLLWVIAINFIIIVFMWMFIMFMLYLLPFILLLLRRQIRILSFVIVRLISQYPLPVVELFWFSLLWFLFVPIVFTVKVLMHLLVLNLHLIATASCVFSYLLRVEFHPLLGYGCCRPSWLIILFSLILFKFCWFLLIVIGHLMLLVFFILTTLFDAVNIDQIVSIIC